MNADSFQVPLVRLFIGERVENKSDQEALAAVCEALAKIGCWACVFANFKASQRQIDVAVFTESSTLVIEAKGYAQPVRGGVNGLWEQLGPYGSRKLRNGYVQTLEARNALRDEMSSAFPVNGYPSGLLAVVPRIPDGSALPPGDFKVSVGDLQHIEKMLSKPSGATLSATQCEALARKLGLENVSSLQAALHEDVLSAERSCTAYLKAFLDFHSPRAAKLVGDEYIFEGEKVGLSDVQAISTSLAQGLLIRGPSGCGKSLLAMACATLSIKSGVIPVFLASKDFDGKLQRLLDGEAALLGGSSSREIVSASKRLGNPIVLFLDGYNECRDDLKVSLTRSLRAFALRYGAGIVITSQQALSRADLLATNTVSVLPPTASLKATLAKIDSDDDNSGNCESLLHIVSSGLEAELIGKAGALLPVGASRFALFDTYARMKLGADAADGIKLLSTFAATLIDRACFSLSIREFDRLCESLGRERLKRDALMRSHLLDTRGDRVSFAHEMFFAAFAAEAAIRAACGNSARIHDALKSPRFHSSKSLILGAIEDDRVLQAVLEASSDQSLFEACIQGECGRTAKSLLKDKLDAMLTDMVTQSKGIEFQVIGEGWHGTTISIDLLRPDLQTFDQYLPAIGLALMQGFYLDEVMVACRHMDHAISVATASFAAEAKAKKIPLRHELFSQAYVFQRKAAISQLVNFIHSGGLSLRRKLGSGFESSIKVAWSKAQTPGEFYALIGLTKFTEHDAWAAKHIAELLERIRTLPYHLQLDLMDFSGYLRDAEEPYRTRMVEALEESLGKLGIMMNWMIFEALKRLGALDDQEAGHVEVIQREIEDTLGSEGLESDQMAWSLFSRQFDHPYDSAYWEEIQGLEDSKKKRLLTKACRGASAPHVSFLGILIKQLAQFNDPDVAPVIQPWTRLPDKKSFSPQDAVEVFLSAHEALGSLGVSLPKVTRDVSNNADCALQACGELFYWSCRSDVKTSEYSGNTLPARNVLLDHSKNAGAGALLLTTSRMLSSDGLRTNLARAYPDTAAAVCREALKRRDSQVSYFENGFNDGPESIAGFAVQVLGAFGHADDLRALRSFCDDERHGISALTAIRQIEDRTSYRPTPSQAP